MTGEQRTLNERYETSSEETFTQPPVSGDTDDAVVVKLTSKAVQTDSALAELKARGGETASYPSRMAAEEELVTNEEVRLQSADANSDKYDYYLVRTRPPEVAPDDRGSPEDGWQFQARGNEVGQVAEALLTAVSRHPTPIVQYACRDLDVERSALRFRQRESLAQFQTITAATGHSWQPDGVFAVYESDEWESTTDGMETDRKADGTVDALQREEVSRRREERALCRVYPLEVKHDSAKFGRTQRPAMHALAENDDDRVVPLLVRVTLDELPQHYGIRIRSGPFTDI